MQVFKRLSAAVAAAGDAPYLRVQGTTGVLYIVGIERSTEVALIGRPVKRGSQINPSRLTTGFVGLGHLDRLGNANAAYAERLNREPTFDQAGLAQRFYRESDSEDYAVICQAEKAAKAKASA